MDISFKFKIVLVKQLQQFWPSQDYFFVFFFFRTVERCLCANICYYFRSQRPAAALSGLWDLSIQGFQVKSSGLGQPEVQGSPCVSVCNQGIGDLLSSTPKVRVGVQWHAADFSRFWGVKWTRVGKCQIKHLWELSWEWKEGVPGCRICHIA